MRMELREIAEAIGIAKYPAALEEMYQATVQTIDPACDMDLIKQLQDERNFFGEYYDQVCEAAALINADENRSAWVKNAVAYARVNKTAKCRTIPTPKADGTLVSAMLPVFILVPLIPDAIEEYRRRGFPEEEIRGFMAGFKGSMRAAHRRLGLPGLDTIYFNWQCLFAKAVIYKAEGLQFELRQLPANAAYIKNKQSGKVLTMMNKGMVHRTGLQMLGSAGYEDEEGAFEVSFREDEENFYGFPCENHLIATSEQVFSKKEWEIFLRPDDDVLSIHIPRGCDMSPEAVDRYFNAGFKIADERYPDYNCKALYGYSWILDPHLEEMLGEESKITNFQRRFIKYPPKSDGTAVFMFVFNGRPENLEDLEETTSLHRKLKKVYLDGGYNHPYAGIIVR